MENRMKTFSRYLLWAALPALLLVAGCRAKNNAEAGHAAELVAHEAEAPGSVTLTVQAVAAADIKTEVAAMRSVARRTSAAGSVADPWTVRELNCRSWAIVTTDVRSRYRRGM